MTRSAKIAATLGSLLALAAGVSRADDRTHAGDTLTTTVSVAGLDLGRTADASVLRRRMHTASVELCLRATEELVMDEQQTAFSRCVASATDQGLRDAALTLARKPSTPPTAFALR